MEMHLVKAGDKNPKSSDKLLKTPREEVSGGLRCAECAKNFKTWWCWASLFIFIGWFIAIPGRN